MRDDFIRLPPGVDPFCRFSVVLYPSAEEPPACPKAGGCSMRPQTGKQNRLDSFPFRGGSALRRPSGQISPETLSLRGYRIEQGDLFWMNTIKEQEFFRIENEKNLESQLTETNLNPKFG
jgi:hypothetical protein